MASVEVNSDGVVVVSYHDLVEAPHSLGPAIAKAFGSEPDCLGLIIVKDLPQEFSDLRLSLLKLAYVFAQLDEKTRDKYSDPSSHYSFGWSHGKEIMNGEPDLLKGSYYATVSSPLASLHHLEEEEKHQFPEYYGTNIWPESSEPGLSGFRTSFEALGQFVLNVGCFLACACQPFVAEHMLDKSLDLTRIIKQSHTTKARLLHYFPPSTDRIQDEEGVNACGYHLDHSLLTGLCSALYLSSNAEGPPDIVSSPSPVSGLYIKTRGGRVVKTSIPSDCLAFQTGEALQLATGGKLRATPHYVRVDGTKANSSVSRETFALFMQPNTDQMIGPNETFGCFSRRVFDEHYDS